MLLYLSWPQAPWEFWRWIILLIPLEIFAMLLYVVSIRDAPLSETLPYLSFTPVFSILTGWIMLDEQISLKGGIGIVLVCLGAYLLNLEKGKKSTKFNWLTPMKVMFTRKESRYMVLVAFIYSITSVVSKATLLYVKPMHFAAFYFVILGFTVLVVTLIVKPKAVAVLKINMRPNILVSGLISIMVVTHFLAISKIEVAYMIAVKRLSLLFGILYGAYLFHESGLSKNILAVVLMIAGTIVILAT